jgi:tripartite ATP-independent transporter DctM subunit
VLGISASTLFLAAVIPGLLVMFAIMITNVIMNRIYKYENSNLKFSFKRWIKAIYDGRFALMVPFIILGGIYSGIFTPTEAAAVAVVSTLIIGLVQGTIKISDFPKMMESSARVNGVIVPIIAISLPLAQALAILNIPQSFVLYMTTLTSDPTILILLMIVILVIAGCVMETTPNIVILSPLLLPLAQEIGMNEIHFCIMMVTALGAGFITPPFGLNLFVVATLTNTPILPIAARAVPFVIALLSVVLLIAFVPEISLWAF